MPLSTAGADGKFACKVSRERVENFRRSSEYRRRNWSSKEKVHFFASESCKLCKAAHSTHHHRTEAPLQGSGGAWSQRLPYPVCAVVGSNEATETICDLCNGFLCEDGHLQAHTQNKTKHHSRLSLLLLGAN